MASPLAEHWSLDPSADFLNHGSFGACPIPVLDHQARLRDSLEADPVRFMTEELEPLIDKATLALATFIGSDPADVVPVPNATGGVSAVLRSLRFEPGDELLTTDHAYNACRNALEFVAARAGAKVVVADIPYPIESPHQVTEAVLAAVTPRTALAMLDHVTSDTALVFPIAELVNALQERGIDTLVDGAHGPGMVPLAVEELGAAYYTGNCHKWLCAPKGAAFLHVRPDRQAGIVPPVISHGANSTRTDRSQFQLMFQWTGTADATAFLAVPTALEFMGGLVGGGWPEVMATNRSLVLAGRDTVCNALGVDPAAPDEMIGSMAAIPLPPSETATPPDLQARDPLETALAADHGIRVPITRPWEPMRSLRLSAQMYNDLDQYRRLARTLTSL